MMNTLALYAMIMLQGKLVNMSHYKENSILTGTLCLKNLTHWNVGLSKSGNLRPTRWSVGGFPTPPSGRRLLVSAPWRAQLPHADALLTTAGPAL
ncbi:hypothetical protein TNCV_1412291 [Trichonephila clavipes]|nr:hypothetical protein TNCV_1412291 [Trichonephila clavipes]